MRKYRFYSYRILFLVCVFVLLGSGGCNVGSASSGSVWSDGFFSSDSKPYVEPSRLSKDELDSYVVSGEVVPIARKYESYTVAGTVDDGATIYSDGTILVSHNGLTAKETLKDPNMVKKILYLGTRANPVTEAEKRRFSESPDNGGSDIYVFNMNTDKMEYVYSNAAKDNPNIHVFNDYSNELVRLVRAAIDETILYDEQRSAELVNIIQNSELGKTELKSELLSRGYENQLADSILLNYQKPLTREECVKELLELGYSEEIAEVIAAMPETEHPNEQDEGNAGDIRLKNYIDSLLEKTFQEHITYNRLEKNLQTNHYTGKGTTTAFREQIQASSMDNSGIAEFPYIKRIMMDCWDFKKLRKTNMIMDGIEYTVIDDSTNAYYIYDNKIRYIIHNTVDKSRSDTHQIIDVLSISY